MLASGNFIAKLIAVKHAMTIPSDTALPTYFFILCDKIMPCYAVGCIFVSLRFK